MVFWGRGSEELAAGMRFQMEPLLLCRARTLAWSPLGPSDKQRVGPHGSLSCLEGATSAVPDIHISSGVSLLLPLFFPKHIVFTAHLIWV